MSKLNVDQKTIKDLFQSKKSDFLIPDYQRPYAWGEAECRTLWDDIFSFAIPDEGKTEFDSNSEYFLGPIVTFRNEDKLEVIDGQQRLTTLMLLLRAFYSKFGHMQDKASISTKQNIEKCLWKTDEFGEPDMSQLKIDSEVATDNDKEEFLEILRTGIVNKEKKKSKLQQAQDEAQAAINETNKKIEELGKHSNNLCIELNNIQKLFDEIRNIPSEKKIECEKLKKIRLNWKQQAEKIESDYKAAAVKNAGAGAAGVSAGVAVAAMGPTAAMGIATTFGVASTGTAISTLSGAAATNAALAWLGGGALAAGGGGMAAGEAFLTLAGPVGWAIAGVALVASGIMFWRSSSKKKRIEEIFTLISKRDVKSYKLAVVELSERITRIDEESKLLRDAIVKVKSFGTDYDAMTEAQQYELGAYVNLMLSSTQLLVNPILGLQPKYGNEDFEKFISWKGRKTDKALCNDFKTLIISFANLLYKIDLDDNDKRLLYKTFKGNKKMLSALNMKKKEFKIDILNAVEEALLYSYK